MWPGQQHHLQRAQARQVRAPGGAGARHMYCVRESVWTEAGTRPAHEEYPHIHAAGAGAGVVEVKRASTTYLFSFNKYLNHI